MSILLYGDPNAVPPSGWEIVKRNASEWWFTIRFWAIAAMVGLGFGVVASVMNWLLHRLF